MDYISRSHMRAYVNMRFLIGYKLFETDWMIEKTCKLRGYNDYVFKLWSLTGI